jgi:hypothetical protein
LRNWVAVDRGGSATDGWDTVATDAAGTTVGGGGAREYPTPASVERTKSAAIRTRPLRPPMRGRFPSETTADTTKNPG